MTTPAARDLSREYAAGADELRVLYTDTITIVARGTATEDVYGGTAYADGTRVQVEARHRELSSREADDLARVGVTAEHSFQVHPSVLATERDAVEHDGRTYTVVSVVLNPMAKRLLAHEAGTA